MTNEASAEASQSTAAASSSGAPMRPMACSAASCPRGSRPRRGSRIEDHDGSLRLDAQNLMPQAQPHALEIDRDDAVERLLAHLRRRAGLTLDAGVVDSDVAAPRTRAPCRPRARRRLRPWGRPPARIARGTRLGDIARDHARALARERDRRGAPDARPAPVTSPTFPAERPVIAGGPRSTRRRRAVGRSRTASLRAGAGRRA